jgi:hypothetical protein
MTYPAIIALIVAANRRKSANDSGQGDSAALTGIGTHLSFAPGDNTTLSGRRNSDLPPDSARSSINRAIEDTYLPDEKLQMPRHLLAE